MISKTEFQKLFDNYFDTIRNFVYYRCGDTETASDITQEVFMKIWEKHKQFEVSDIKSLLYKMANDMAISNYRKEQTQLNFEQSMTIEQDYDASPEEMVQFEELKSSYARALTDMPENQRVTFLMNRNEGLKYHEIAENLNISIKTVEKRISTALAYLKKELL
ncbi:RNA polymerase sigma-70 factor [Dysgonomonas sp. 216]|uniref:RNA polymerase sigma factor n=1 Tax=Dysgonomonas sp. 216 TaxID=2302934 RepID=UPI0013D8AA88|nr:RNA polymerase sigma-70 factor [Dysgonomonas sp. 216]